ncbi:MAG: apolipoprotein N-acyltransferase [Actinomycetota bacterium]|nr:apolipoprotein N-acyltransferase [Actinomycetota bacterium]
MIAPLLVLGRGSARHGFACGFVFGLGFFGSLLVWISVVGWIAWTVLVLMEALYLGLFGASWAVLSRADRKWWVLLAPAAWVTAEVLRASVPVVGFPWGELAQSQGVFPWLLQIAQLGGGETVSFLLVAVNACVALAFLERGVARLRWTAAGVIAIAAMVPLSFLLPAILPTGAGGDGEVLRVAIIQGNASPGVEVEDGRARVARHLRLTQALVGERIDLVVWPESSVGIDPFTDENVASMVAEAARAVDAWMIVGANLDAGEDRYNVVTLLIDPTGEIVDVYQKTHLVPFGEYVPWREALDWIPMLEQIPRDAVAGDTPKNFVVPGREGPGLERLEHEIGTVISFEGDFGHLVRERVALGARVMTVATNTSTWKRTWASAQHLAMSQVRAAETGVPVIHAALSGISAFVYFDGTVGKRTDLYEEATIVSDVATGIGSTVYVRTGEWLPIICTLGTISAVAAALARRRNTVRT